MGEKRATSPDRIAAVRRFNRFYTRQIGLLDEGILKSPFSLTEARILYELAHADGLTATDVARDLGLDAGYLSRLLKKFEADGLIQRRTSAADARQSLLTLTRTGREAFAPLERASNDQVARVLGELDPEDGERLMSCMASIEQILGGAAKPAVPYILRPPEPGDLGLIVSRQTVLYHREHGWDWTFEGLAAEIAAHFVAHYDPAMERCWVAERDGRLVGSVFCVRESDTVAKLRMLFVEPSARGLGIGGRLVEEVVRFARARGYRTLTLWTQDVLVSARRIYQAAGFHLADEAPYKAFGKDLVSQNWELAL